MNFLELDDVPLAPEGEPIDPDSIVPLPFRHDKPVFPEIKPGLSDRLREIELFSSFVKPCLYKPYRVVISDS